MSIIIDNRELGTNTAPYIVAELSANHNGDLDRALRMIELAKENGADAIKIQTYTADTMTLDVDLPDFKIQGGPWDGYSLYKLYEEAHTPWEWHEKIFEKAKEVGITVFSTPFDKTSVDFLEELGVSAYKVASFEIVDLPLIKYIASQGKPIIISTGMANLEEIEEAVQTVKSVGNDQLIVLHCVSGYPAPVSDMNLKTIEDISKRFGVLSGLSDHSLGVTASVASIAFGACFIEKHFIDSRKNKGPDSAFSIEPHELKALCEESKLAWQAIGKVDYERKTSEKQNLVFRRSLYYTKDLEKGEVISEENIRSIRPGYGLSPKNFEEILGRKVKTPVTRGQPVSWESIE